MANKWHWTYESGTLVTGYGKTIAYEAVVKKRSNDELVGIRAVDGAEYAKNRGNYGDGKFYSVEEYGKSPDKPMGLQACRRKDERPHKPGKPGRPRKTQKGFAGLKVIGKDADGNWIIGKWCPGHREVHPVSEFGDNAADRRTGYQTYCRKYHNDNYGRNRRREKPKPSVEGLDRRVELTNTIKECAAELAKIYRAEGQ